MIKHHRLALFTSFAFVVACSGQIASSDGSSSDPSSSGTNGNGSGSSGSSSASGSASSGGGASSNGACANLAGTYLISQGDCGYDDFVIAQTGCDVAIHWFSGYSGSVSGNTIAFTEASGEPVCSATVTDSKISGTCNATKPDGGPWTCSFDGIASH